MSHFLRKRSRPSLVTQVRPERSRTPEAQRAEEHELNTAAQRSETARQLRALMSFSITLLTEREIRPILVLATMAAQQLFPGASAILAFLADNTGFLSLLAANGREVAPVQFPRDQGLVAHAFLTPRPMLIAGPELDVMLEMHTPQQQDALLHALESFPPTSAIVVPLRTDTDRLGALFISGGHHAHLFLPRDLSLAQALGSLIAVALAEAVERERSSSLQHALLATRTLHAEAEARLNTAQAQLLQSAKLAAVGELAASVAHEINNPLYAARNSLYLVEQDLPQDAPQRPFLEIAQSELSRIAKIVSRMRDFYRPTRDELEPVAINALIEETLELVQTHLRRGQITIQRDLDPCLPTLIGHADQIRQVFLNLMINACDAMPDGGTLRVVTTQAPVTSDETALIQITIEDTGAGIPEEHVSRIFEPFYTTKAHGTGLGLAISAHIITQHGGQISVASEVGQGTTFTIVLPVSKNGEPGQG